MKANENSRWAFDLSEYSLSLGVFNLLLQVMSPNSRPVIDMFASPATALLPHFVARWPHHRALMVSAVVCDLSPIYHVFAHRPWPLIGPWLHRLRDNPHILSITVVPMWASESWWAVLTTLHVRCTPILKIMPRCGLYRNAHLDSMPRLRVRLLCILLSGKLCKPGGLGRLKFQVI